MWIETSPITQLIKTLKPVYFWQTNMHVAKRQLFKPADDSFTSFFLRHHSHFDFHGGLRYTEEVCLLSHNYNLILLLHFFFYTAIREHLINIRTTLQGANRHRNQIHLYKSVSCTCPVETPHLRAPLQVNNMGPLSSTWTSKHFHSVAVVGHYSNFSVLLLQMEKATDLGN